MNIIKKTDIEETIATIPTVMVKTTFYTNKKTGEFLGKKDEWQDKKGNWHLI